MASRQLTVKLISVLGVATLKCLQPGRVKVPRLVQVCSTSCSVESQRKDRCELLNRGRHGGDLYRRENYLRGFTGSQGVYPFGSRTMNDLGTPMSSRRLHSTSDCSDNQIRDSSTRPVRVRSENDPLIARAYQELLRAATDIDPHEPALKEILNKCREAAEYNLPGGKRIRLLGLVHTYELLAEESRPHLELACLLGWCVELMHSSILIIDDIMDRSLTRRGRPSWHTVIGLRAINDALFFDKATRWVIRHRLRDLRCYQALTELFQDCDLRIVLGQGLDMVSERLPLSQLDANRFWTIATYKTGFYTSVLHIRAGMLLAGVNDPVLHAKAEQAALHLGRVFQVQDDFLDSFGDPKTTGKVGVDIVAGKCSWLAVKAAQLASPAQRAVLEANLGKGVPGGPEEAAVKALYEELDLRGHFAAFEKTAFAELDSYLRDMPAGLATAFRFVRHATIGRDK